MPWTLNFGDGGVVQTDRNTQVVEGQQSDDEQNLMYDVESLPICTSCTVYG